MKKFLAILAIYVMVAAQPAFAIDLQTAKDRGMVGETPSGYLEAVTQPTSDVSELIRNINAQRKQKFKEIAARNNTSLEAVEQLAGKKAIEKSRPGSYIKIGGTWQQK